MLVARRTLPEIFEKSATGAGCLVNTVVSRLLMAEHVVVGGGVEEGSAEAVHVQSPVAAGPSPVQKPVPDQIPEGRGWRGEIAAGQGRQSVVVGTPSASLHGLGDGHGLLLSGQVLLLLLLLLLLGFVFVILVDKVGGEGVLRVAVQRITSTAAIET